jgi:gamma-glutamylcyclotransferase
MMYFAYGSNMDAQRMKDRRVQFSQRIHAFLKGYALRFNKLATKDAQEGEGKGNIIRDENEVVEGALYEIPESDLKKLDHAEGYPNHYDRLPVEVELEDGRKVQALTYIAQPRMIREGLKPTREYLSHYLAARDILSEACIQKLRSIETLD